MRTPVPRGKESQHSVHFPLCGVWYRGHMDLEAALADADLALKEAAHQLDQLRERVDALQLERRGLELALARHRGEPVSDAASDHRENEWLPLPRTEAILQVMARTDEPMAPVEITRQLKQFGRSDSGHAVSAALSYLHREDRVQSLGRGQWVLVAPALRPFHLEETNGSDVVDSNGSAPHAEKPPSTDLAIASVATESPSG